MKLVDQRQADWQNRAQFFAIAAQVMRRILVDAARHKLRGKRGGGETPVPIDAVSVAGAEIGVNRLDVVALDRALDRLCRVDPGQAKVVELRFFAGMTVEETAAVLDVSPGTVKREWALAKAWLYNELTTGTRQGGPR
jgi:RNA polymerase sigma-70 factor (ECF subfamily)